MCGFCNCVAACWEGFHQCTDALENQIWTWECFLEMENESWWHVYTSQMDPVQNHFFVKKQYPPFAKKIFFEQLQNGGTKSEYSHHTYPTCSLVLQLSSILTIINDCCSLIFFSNVIQKKMKKETQYTKAFGRAKWF